MPPTMVTGDSCPSNTALRNSNKMDDIRAEAILKEGVKLPTRVNADNLKGMIYSNSASVAKSFTYGPNFQHASHLDHLRCIVFVKGKDFHSK